VKPSGLVLVIAGVWVLCQVLGGDALGRLGITAGPVGAAVGAAAGKGIEAGAGAVA
jgi:hypothetical protein